MQRGTEGPLGGNRAAAGPGAGTGGGKGQGTRLATGLAWGTVSAFRDRLLPSMPIQRLLEHSS